MKKVLALITLALMLFSMAACGEVSEVAETTAAKKNIMQKSDPAEDDVFNLLMVGHSGCYYYTDELYNVAKAAGVKMRVCNVYYSGCPLEKHWTWWKNGEAHYDFYVIDENGKQEFNEVDLKFCMEQYNWDAITLMENSSITRKTSGKEAFANNETYIADLFGYFKAMVDAKYDGPVCLEVIGPDQTMTAATAIAAKSYGYMNAILKSLGAR